MNSDQECSGMVRAAELDHVSRVLSPASKPQPIPGASEPWGHVSPAELCSMRIPKGFYAWCLELENPA